MPTIPNRFVEDFGEVFPYGAFVLGVEDSMAFQADSNAPKQQERDKETNQLVWIGRAIDANEEAPGGARASKPGSAEQKPAA